MKHVITVPAPLLRAARLYQPQQDIRHYLNGVHLNPEGYIESTDGRSAFRAPCEACKSLDKPIILRIQASGVGRGDELAHIYLDDNGLGWITFGDFDDERRDNAGMVVRVMVQTIDGNFPDLKKVYPDESRPVDPVSEIGVDSELVNQAGQAIKALGFRYTHLRLGFSSESRAISAQATQVKDGYDHLIMIMPVRLD